VVVLWWPLATRGSSSASAVARRRRNSEPSTASITPGEDLVNGCLTPVGADHSFADRRDSVASSYGPERQSAW
jgi:hypothetical protein